MSKGQIPKCVLATMALLQAERTPHAAKRLQQGALTEMFG